MQWFTSLGLMGYPMVLLSFAALVIIAERALFFMKHRRLTGPEILAGFERQASAIKHKDYARLSALLWENKKLQKASRDEVLSLAVQETQKKYFLGTHTLRVISAMSPLMGLLGTVLGMIHSFHSLASHQGPVSPALLADGLSEAMYTTAFGLIIALPCLLAAHVYQRLAEQHVDTLTHALNNLSLSFEGASLGANDKEDPKPSLKKVA